MSKAYLYICGQGKAAQRERLQAAFPAGEEIIDRRPPEMLEQLIAAAGPGDLIAADNITAIPEITAETYSAICGKGAALCFMQQPYLNSEIFSAYLTSGNGKPVAAAILQRQIEAAAAQQAQQRARVKAGLDAAAAESRKGGRRAGEKQTNRKELYMKETMRALMAQGVTGPELLEKINEGAGELQISRNTFYKYRRELKAQEEAQAAPRGKK